MAMDLDPVDHTARSDLEEGDIVSASTSVCSLVAGIVTKEIHTDEPENKCVCAQVMTSASVLYLLLQLLTLGPLMKAF